jgi:uncharacterized membrane protein YfcA
MFEPIDLRTFAVVFLASFAQGVVGFGFGLVTMALLPLFLPEKFAVAFVAVYSLGVSCMILYQMRRHIRFSHAMPLFIGTILGVPLGVLALDVADPNHVKLTLGITLLAYSSWALFSRIEARERQFHTLWGYLAGLSSGLLGAFNTGGPPLVVYTTLKNWDKDTTKSTLQLIFILTSIFQLPGLAATGLLTSESLLKNLYIAPSIVLGVALGHRLYQRIDQLTFKRALLSLLLIVGIVYIEKALTSL